jgi:uncharacterized membrane protein YhaH (DUF805 family)
MLGLPELLFLMIFCLVAFVPFWKIFSKAGYSGWLCLLMAIPLINVITVFWFAFADWPALRGQSKADN